MALKKARNRKPIIKKATNEETETDIENLDLIEEIEEPEMFEYIVQHTPIERIKARELYKPGMVIKMTAEKAAIQNDNVILKEI